MGEVYKAIAAVQGELAKTGIAKNRRNQQGSGYNFRGIDDVYAALSPLLSAHGLVIIPRMTAREVVERSSKNGGALFYTTVKADFDFVSAADGSVHTACTYGEAMDSGDKSTNKAMSAAYKYAAFLTFAIPTEGDNDADATTHDVAPAHRPRAAAPANDPPPEKAKAPTKLSAQIKAFMNEVNRAPDIDSFEALIASEAALIAEVKRDRPGWWTGAEIPDGPGMADRIEQVREALRAEAMGKDDWRGNVLNAG